MIEITDCKTCRELSKDKKMNIYLNVLFEVSLWKFVLILSSQIN